MREAIFFAVLAAGGWGLAQQLAPGRGRLLPAALAVPLGTLLWAVLAILLMMALDVPPAASLAAYAVASVGLALHACWRRERTVAGWAALAATLLLVAGAAWTASRQAWILVSFDSIAQIAAGRSIAAHGLQGVGGLLASWGGLVPLVQGAGVGLKVDVIQAFQPLMALSLLAVCAWGTWQLAARFKALAVCVVLLTLSGCYFLVMQSQYVHNSLPSAVYLAAAALLCAVAWQRDDAVLLRPAFACLAAFCLCRTEAPVFAACALVLGAALATQCSIGRAYARLATIFCAAIGAWYLFLIAVIGKGSDIMSPGRLAIVLLVLLAAWAVTQLLPMERLRRLRPWVPELVIAVGLAALALATAWQPAHMLENVDAIYRNLTTHGRWGLAWVTLAFAAPLAWRLNAGSRALLALTVSFTALILLMGMARIPYRLGWGDSANRMFTHLWPLLVVAVAAGATSFRTLPHAVTTRSALRLAVPAGVAAGIVIAALALWPRDFARSAIVRQAEGFCPADGGLPHDFSMALAPTHEDSYAAACVTGPRDVVLELPKARRLRRLHLFEYHVEQAWQDFGVSTSADGKTWHKQYDTRDPALQDRIHRLAPVQLRVKLDGERVRFVRIEFRGALGQNRLLLRRLAIY